MREAPASRNSGLVIAILVAGTLLRVYTVTRPPRIVEPPPPPITRVSSGITEDVAVMTDDGVLLRGTLIIPQRPYRTPASVDPGAVVVIGGSGGQDRDGTRPDLPRYHVLQDIALSIEAAGVVSLRLDERGVGDSEGAPGAPTSRRAGDVAAAVEYLRARFPERTVGLIGHSEGGLVAMLAAARDSSIRSIVLLATPSRPGREVARAQRQLVASSGGKSRSPSEMKELLRNAEAAAESLAIHDLWLREWFSLDPREYASRQRGRALVIHGENDLQVPVSQADELSRSLSQAGVEVTMVRVPGMNHLLLADSTGTPARYGTLTSQMLDFRVAMALLSWLRRDTE